LEKEIQQSQITKGGCVGAGPSKMEFLISWFESPRVNETMILDTLV